MLPALVVVPALLPDWLNPETLLTNFGDVAFWAALVIIFAECGLLIGFFLPGDSLLFVVGLFIAQGFIDVNIWVAAAALSIVAFLGNVVGYWIGAAIGPKLFSKPESRIFKQEYVVKTHAFFERHGGPAIILARFVPIVRTFITAIAGVGRMDLRHYLLYSAIGAVLWGGLITVLGYFLGNIPIIEENLEIALILIVLISVLPMIFEWLRSRRNRIAE
jgi:membrane-associated protein